MNTYFTIKDCALIDVNIFTDGRGSLSVLENDQPFALSNYELDIIVIN